MWYNGDPTKTVECAKASHLAVACAKQLAKSVGLTLDTAKSHDVEHVPYDLEWFGSSKNCDTGPTSDA